MLRPTHNGPSRTPVVDVGAHETRVISRRYCFASVSHTCARALHGSDFVRHRVGKTVGNRSIPRPIPISYTAITGRSVKRFRPYVSIVSYDNHHGVLRFCSSNGRVGKAHRGRNASETKRTRRNVRSRRTLLRGQRGRKNVRSRTRFKIQTRIDLGSAATGGRRAYDKNNNARPINKSAFVRRLSLEFRIVRGLEGRVRIGRSTKLPNDVYVVVRSQKNSQNTVKRHMISLLKHVTY